MLELNKIYNMNCLTEGFKLLNDKSIDLVITDPPYLHNLKRFAKGGHNGNMANSNMYSADSVMMSEMSNFTYEQCTAMLNECKRVMKLFDGYFFCNDRLLGTYCHWADKNNLYVNLLTWNKPLSILDRRRYSTNCEYIVRIHTPSGTGLNKLNLDEHPEYKEYYSKYRYFPQIKGKGKLHPLQKPIDLINGYLLVSSKEGDVILDPFSGSGTTGVACKLNNRNFIGFEINKEYCDIANRRLNETIIS